MILCGDGARSHLFYISDFMPSISRWSMHTRMEQLALESPPDVHLIQSRLKFFLLMETF